MTTIYDLYEDNPWRKVAEITKEELSWPGMAEIQEQIGRTIVPQTEQKPPICSQDQRSVIPE